MKYVKYVSTMKFNTPLFGHTPAHYNTSTHIVPMPHKCLNAE